MKCSAYPPFTKKGAGENYTVLYVVELVKSLAKWQFLSLKFFTMQLSK